MMPWLHKTWRVKQSQQNTDKIQESASRSVEHNEGYEATEGQGTKQK
jgi:hypothetical protein